MNQTILVILLLVCAMHAGAIAPSDCWQMQKHDRKAEAQRCFDSLTKSQQPNVRAEGFWGLQDWQQANELFRVATRSTAVSASDKVRWGMLLHERFNNNEAADLFREALSQDPNNVDAYIGLAIVSMDSFDGKASFYLSKAISVDPRRAKAHELMSSIALENDDRELATKEADKALELESDALDAMSVRAAIELLSERSPDTWIEKVRSVNPHYGPAFSQIAHQLDLHYRHDDAVTYYRKAVAADPTLWSAHSDLGLGLMRMGQQEEAQKELTLAYDNGYRDAATVNSLRLLDSYKNYITAKDETTVLTLKKTEADLLRPYFQNELHQILTTYDEKYRMTLPAPVQVEVYPDHEDFAVRTMGMPGLGALGVTFGEVIAMDSPSARKPGDFNWGATLWHEMSHVYVLTATKNHVPRWFTEGVAVHEEGKHSPEWSNRATPDVIVAIRDKKLLPILKLDRGFVYPEYPAQVIVSYFQAGSICDFIASHWSETALLDMVHSYAKMQTTEQTLQDVLKIDPAQFDTQYMAWIDKRYGSTTSHYDEWREKLRALATAYKAKQWDLVVAQGPAIIALYPEYVGDVSVYQLLAEAYRAINNSSAERTVLGSYVHAGGEDPGLPDHDAGGVDPHPPSRAR